MQFLCQLWKASYSVHKNKPTTFASCCTTLQHRCQPNTEAKAIEIFAPVSSWLQHVTTCYNFCISDVHITTYHNSELHVCCKRVLDLLYRLSTTSQQPTHQVLRHLQRFPASLATGKKKTYLNAGYKLWLVVDYTPLKNMKVKWDDDIPNTWENIKCSKLPTRTGCKEHSYGSEFLTVATAYNSAAPVCP